MAYKTEKRQARVGERILIVDAEPLIRDHYKNGDVLVVSYVDEDGDVFFKGDILGARIPENAFIVEEEYEVIVGEG